MSEEQGHGQPHQTLHIAVNGWFYGQLDAGSGQYLHHLLAHLPRLPRGLRLTLLLPPDIAAADLPVGVEVVQPSLPSGPTALRKMWWEQWAVPRAATQVRADLLWVPYWGAPWWQPVPVCVTVHDLIPLLLPAYRGNWRLRAYTSLVCATARRSAALLTVSQASKQDIITHLRVPPERVHVVYHGPNQEATHAPDADELAAVRSRYGLPQRYFLYLGGFDVRKNVAAIVAAYRRYLDQGGDPAVKLVLAGKRPRQDSAFSPDPRRLADEHNLGDSVVICGWVDERDKPALYAQATAFLFPSLYEGFGMPVLEAMAAGTPVLTSG